MICFSKYRYIIKHVSCCCGILNRSEIQLISVQIGFSQFSPVQSTPTRIEQLLQLEDVFPINFGDIAMLVYQRVYVLSLPSTNQQRPTNS